MMRRPLWNRSLLGLALLAIPLSLAGDARAVGIYDVLGPGTEDGFGFSWIHEAKHAMVVDGTTYYPGGSKLFRLSGSFAGEWSGNTFSFLPSTLTATGAGYMSGATWDFTIAGGSLDVSSGRPHGTIDYVLSHSSGRSSSGSFVVDPVHFAGPANSASDDEIAVWANNWAANPNHWEQVEDRPLRYALGLDLRAVRGFGAPVPEPQAIVAFVIGALVVGGGALRARTRS